MEVQGKTRAAVVVAASDASETSYLMYEANGVTSDGATLTGPLLLEPGERLELELALESGIRVRLQARVALVHNGSSPRMEVRFSNVSEEIRKVLHG